MSTFETLEADGLLAAVRTHRDLLAAGDWEGAAALDAEVEQRQSSLLANLAALAPVELPRHVLATLHEVQTTRDGAMALARTLRDQAERGLGQVRTARRISGYAPVEAANQRSAQFFEGAA